MGVYTLDEIEALRETAEVENALFDGYPEKPRPSNATIKRPSCFSIAADRLGLIPESLRGRIGTSSSTGANFRRHGDKCIVNWMMYRPRAEAPAAEPDAPPVAPEAPPADPIEVRRARDEATRLRAQLAEAERRVTSLEDIRGGIAGLFQDPPAPKPLTFPKRPDAALAEIPLINLFDVQWGEVVDLHKMDGLNSYNAAIAEARLGRFFAHVIDLLTNHWKGPPPPKAYFALGGDLVSGEIHEELAKTNDRSSIESVRDLVGLLENGLERLAAALKCDIEVISVPGNHGRITKKPESKRYAIDSYDTLVAWILEQRFNRPGSPITITVPPSGDALVSIYNRNVLWTHGDRIGTRGGHGGAGPAAPAARGMKKIIAEYAGRGVVIYLVFMGHIHTSLQLEDGFVSGSMVGPSEFSRDGRFKPRPASQWLLTMHPIWGVAQRWEIYVGDPSEGHIYGTAR